MKRMTIVAAAALAAGVALTACGGTRTIIIRPAATPTPVVTQTTAPAPRVTVTAPAPAQPAAPAAPGTSYAQDITNAGIVAPVDWINSTGQQLCTDWQSGMTTADTDQILLAGGIHPNHLALFDSITESDLCPGVTP